MQPDPPVTESKLASPALGLTRLPITVSDRNSDLDSEWRFNGQLSDGRHGFTRARAAARTASARRSDSGLTPWQRPANDSPADRTARVQDKFLVPVRAGAGAAAASGIPTPLINLYIIVYHV